MVYCLADNILSPLGNTTSANLEAVLLGRSALGRLSSPWGIPGDVTAAVLSPVPEADGLSRVESMAVYSAGEAIKASDIKIDKETVLILSTVKGNIEKLTSGEDFSANYPGASAKRIAEALGIKTIPITVCNACTSGVSAILLASRLIESGAYSKAVVVGAEELGRFIVSGFGAIDSLSKEPCRPFDIERCGLNLGEAAGAMVLGKDKPAGRPWSIRAGAIRNDASGTVAPARDAAGLRRAIASAMEGIRPKILKTVNAHGTGTLFNDQMESIAFAKSGLGRIPVTALKGYFGHTMGAAGLVETIITMAALERGVILPVSGFQERGVSGRININRNQATVRPGTFLKTISGFGGCNAALVVSKSSRPSAFEGQAPQLKRSKSVSITPDGSGRDLITDVYKKQCSSWQRFYKMDALSRLGYVASELLLKEVNITAPKANTGVILFNRSSSVDTDRRYLASLDSKEGWFPSPSLFVYTLPNIVTGEIAIKNGFGGETSLYILPDKIPDVMDMIVKASFLDRGLDAAVCGWIDWENAENFCAELYLVEKQRTLNMEELILELKGHLIEALNLEGMKPEEIDADAPLFGEGLGLDSIDALELIVLMEKKYGVKLANPSEGKAVFKSLRTMAEYIEAHKK